MKVILLNLLLTYQLLLCNDATSCRGMANGTSIIIVMHIITSVAGNCRSLNEIENSPPCDVRPGSFVRLVVANPHACEGTNYLISYHNSTGSTVLYRQKKHRFRTPPIYLNSSGVYCVYKECTTLVRCCVKVTGKIWLTIVINDLNFKSFLFKVTKLEIDFPESSPMDTENNGTCNASTWPRPPMDNMMVTTDITGCVIKTLSVNYTYTTTVFFTVRINSFCEHANIICYLFTPPKEAMKSIRICK